MRIGETTTPYIRLAQQRLEKVSELRNVFSAVLDSVGREGWKLAEPTISDAPLEQQMQSSWEGLMGLDGYRRYQDIASKTEFKPAEIGKAFSHLMNRAYSEGGYLDPKSFLRTLDANDMEMLRLGNGLADTIDVATLSEEGALNLFIPTGAKVDVDGDAITEVGLAQSMSFPDSNTPHDVATAWKEATANLSEWDRIHYEFQIISEVRLNNTYANPDGTFSHQYEPGDEGWRNTMAEPGFYRKFTQGAIGTLDRFKAKIDPLKYERDRAFWCDFQSRLPDEEVLNAK